jgi:hypothetical protein
VKKNENGNISQFISGMRKKDLLPVLHSQSMEPSLASVPKCPVEKFFGQMHPFLGRGRALKHTADANSRAYPFE